MSMLLEARRVWQRALVVGKQLWMLESELAPFIHESTRLRRVEDEEAARLDLLARQKGTQLLWYDSAAENVHDRGHARPDVLALAEADAIEHREVARQLARLVAPAAAARRRVRARSSSGQGRG